MNHIYFSILKLNKNLICTVLTTVFFVFSLFTTAYSNVIITGVFDGPLTGGQPKGVELFVTADVADMSMYGIGSANNGGGTDGEELTMNGSYATGTFIYITSDSAGFADFFGFNADFVDGAANINGDDAIELFMNGAVIDVFGDINVDGSGTNWEYMDGWAYRNDGTGPDGATFVESNWMYSGTNQLEGGTTNADCMVPFPIGTYMDVMSSTPEFDFTTSGLSVEEGDPATISVALSIPADCSIEVVLDAANSTATEGTDFTFSSPETLTFTAAGPTTQDITIMLTEDADVEGDETIVLVLENLGGMGCGLGNVSQVTITITDNDFQEYTIAELTEENADGTAAQAGLTGKVTGIVHCGDFDGNDGYDFTILDATGGIAVFDFQDVDNYVVTEGDEIEIVGTVAQFRGLTQIQPSSITLLSQGNALTPHTVVTDLNESTESLPIEMEGMLLVDPTQWGMAGSSFNVDIIDLSGNVFTMRIDADTDIDDLVDPADFDLGFKVKGIGGQFSSDAAVYTDGYQIRPCSAADFELDPVESIDETFGAEFSIYPNPVTDQLIIDTEINDYNVRITDALGRDLQRFEANSGTTQLDMKNFSYGIYIIIVSSQDKTWSERVLKN